MDYSIQICKQTNPNGSAPIIAEFQTNDVLDFADYLGKAMDYFSGMVRFDSSVTYVGIRISHPIGESVINIVRDDNGKVIVR